ncbi:MAG: germination protein YpeB [Oscillospiraceae bacterium]|nr:germination protein YpeB [Candidatus Equicaccousia limihippi]
MNKRTKVRIISFAVALFLVPCGLAAQFYAEKENYKILTENGYKRSLYELSESIDGLQYSLKKAEYAYSPAAFSTLAAQVSSFTSTAKNALSASPVAAQDVEYLNDFLSKAEDYCCYLDRKMAKGETLSELEKQNVVKLSNAAAKIAETLNRNGGTFDDGEYIELLLNGQNASDNNVLNTALSDIKEQISALPTLIYDGPFSDNVLKREPLLTKGYASVSTQKGKEILSQKFGIKTAFLTECGDSEGVMPCYCYKFDGGSAAVTKRGGFIAYFNKERAVEKSALSYTQAVEKATDFINKNSQIKFTPTYYFSANNICTVNFAVYESGVICYTDLIKVGIAQDNGEVVLYEARGFIENHHARTYDTPKLTPAQAMQKAVGQKVENIKLCLIPSGGLNEILCYELSVKDGEQDILIYVNCQTGEEENIFILRHLPGGSLVM